MGPGVECRMDIQFMSVACPIRFADAQIAVANVAFRSAKAAFFRGAIGDIGSAILNRARYTSIAVNRACFVSAMPFGEDSDMNVQATLANKVPWAQSADNCRNGAALGPAYVCDASSAAQYKR